MTDTWPSSHYKTARYVTAELGYPSTNTNYGMLRARATSIGAWEKFDSVPALGCAIRSVANGRYVSAEAAYPGSSNGELRARSATIGPWEIFGPKPAPPVTVPPGLNCPQWGQALVQYFGYNETPKADAIMWRESRCVPTAVNTRAGCDSSGRTNSHAQGLMQMCVPLLDAQFDAVGCHLNYLDGICNIRAAKHLRDQVGWGPWGG